MYFPLFVGFLCHTSCLSVCPSSFAIILKRKRKLTALLLLFYRCIVTLNVLGLFLVVPWVGLQYMIVVFPDHTHLLFDTINLGLSMVPFCTGLYFFLIRSFLS